MKTTVYLVVSRKGVVRTTKNTPGLARHEIAIQLKLVMPDEAFRSPILSAELTVPEQHIIQPVIECETVEQPA